MQKQAPSIIRVLVAVGFALSCFGLLLFLWITFGGPTPFKAQSYRFKASFPEAVTLAKESDVRIAGITVGEVKALSLPPQGNATEATIELDPRYAPIPSDTRAILRQKTLLGETYIELTGGTDDAEPLEDGGTLARALTRDSTQIDEIFQALDSRTRTAFRVWMQSSAAAVRGRGLDLNDAFGNLGPFTSDATVILRVLDRQDRALQGLVRDTGRVFEALSARDRELAGAITGSNATFGALASRDAALAETVRIFPTFNEETRLTLNRLAEFADDTAPLVRDLKPVADDLSPTLQSLQRLSPHLKRLFVDLDPLISAAREGLPALRRILAQLRPLLAALDPFLANLNPVVRFLNFNKPVITDFLAGATGSAGGKLHPGSYNQPSSTGHALRVTAWFSPETLGIHRTRLPTNRGNAYFLPYAIGNPRSSRFGEPHYSWDCKPSIGAPGANAQGEVRATEDNPGCTVQPDWPRAFGGGAFPQLVADP
jgi:phospholipid/cholesterol/gamma-HCH transport system substrate-binding protein